MSKQLTLSMLASAFLFPAVIAAGPGDEPVVLNDSATATLTDVRCAEVKTQSASEITCFLSFPDSVPNFFYEVDTGTSHIIVKLLNTKTGGRVVSGKIDTVNLGPVATIHAREEVRNKNETVKLLTPEWYSVVLVAISCSPMIRHQKDLVVSPIENAITISFPWPEEPKQRKKYYTFVKKRRRRGLMISLIGLGVVGLGAGGYLAYDRYLRPDETPGDLEPILPEHPSAP
ncbi:MAG: hypothetical protein JW913_09375 [Chitinispirillaceae bacterium]|nr:hypothetical protein [Chitinispirillaceae bacterium]